MDLPYIYSTEGKIKEPNLLAEAGQGLLGAGMSYLRYAFLAQVLGARADSRSGDIGGMMSGVLGYVPDMTRTNTD